MISTNEIIKDGILEIIFSIPKHHNKFYTISCENGYEIMKGKIAGFTQRTCLYIGEFKKGIYTIKIDEQVPKKFEVV
ncbi:MAG: hypothetical protein WCP61_08460 [Chitinophagia bacterium]